MMEESGRTPETICSDLAELASKYRIDQSQMPSVGVAEVISALDRFQDCVRYLNTRRSKGAVLNLGSEADVQDTLYVMLRPWIPDIVSENPTDKVANRYSIKDFLIPSAGVVIEVKFIRDKQHGKSISAEIHDDIEVYRHHPRCKHIVFFIYDVDGLIPDPLQLSQQIEEERVYGGCRLYCHSIIKP
ncbi:MAG: hypothetical protein AAF823_02070 [Planctomycetota bacterium]